MNPTLSIARAKARFAECVRRAEAGESLVLTRHGRPVARLVPVAARVGSPATLAGLEAPQGDIAEPREPYGIAEARRLARPSPASRREVLERLLEESVWPRIPKDQLGVGVSKRERERILGYGGDGV